MTLKEAIDILTEAGIDSPEYDARELFRVYARGADLLTKASECGSEELKQAIRRRAAREPLQYIIGTVGFYREEYKVTPDCLIPRSDTEILVDYAVKHIPEGESLADLCSGSGCIGISTLKNTTGTHCDAFDVSEGAIRLTRENAKINGVAGRISVTKKNLLTEDIDGEYFAILSNPPYIRTAVISTLEKEVRTEPHAALDGGEDGLAFYRAILDNFEKNLTAEGFFLFEIGYDQAGDIIKIARERGFDCEIRRDLGGCDRAAILRRTVSRDGITNKL